MNCLLPYATFPIWVNCYDACLAFSCASLCRSSSTSSSCIRAEPTARTFHCNISALNGSPQSREFHNPAGYTCAVFHRESKQAPSTEAERVTSFCTPILHACESVPLLSQHSLMFGHALSEETQTFSKGSSPYPKRSESVFGLPAIH